MDRPSSEMRQAVLWEEFPDDDKLLRWLSPVCAASQNRGMNHASCDYILCTCRCHS